MAECHKEINFLYLLSLRLAEPTKILSRVRASVTDNNGFWNEWLDLLALLLKLPLIKIIYNKLIIGDCLRLVPFLPGPRASSLPLWLTCTNNVCLTNAFCWRLQYDCFQLRLLVYDCLQWRLITTRLASLSLSLTLLPTVSRPVYLGIKHPSGSYDQIFITVRLLRVCWCGALSLTTGRVCSLQMLLALANSVIFRSESRGTRDHILLPQIRDFPFRHLLRLAGLRWRHATPPPHGILTCESITYPFIIAREPKIEHSIQQFLCSSVIIRVFVVTGTHINPAITKVLSEELSRECVFPKTVAQKWSILRCCVNTEATARCRRYALSEALPSNGLLRLTCFMSQYGHCGLFARRWSYQS
jgi:hypothetical protein